MPGRLVVEPPTSNTKSLDKAYQPQLFHGATFQGQPLDSGPVKLRTEVVSGSRIRSALDRRPTSPLGDAAVVDARRAGLLPTPPMNGHEYVASPSDHQDLVDGRMDDEATAWDRSFAKAEVTTPLNQRAPPTPDITPPSNPFKLASLLPPREQQAPPSSRTESFKTAQEDQRWSEDEADRPPLPSSTGAPPDRYSDRTPLAIPFTIGARPRVADAASASVYGDETPLRGTTGHDFKSFDGSWGSGQKGSSERRRLAGDAPERDRVELERRVAETQDGQDANRKPEAAPVKAKKKRVRKKADKRPAAPGEPSVNVTVSPAVVVTSAEPPLRRHSGKGPSLRERIRQNRDAENRNSTKSFAEKIDWPLATDDPDDGDPKQTTDDKRTSTVSNPSTVIEALLVLDRPRQHRPLRHAGRNIALGASADGMRMRAVTAPEAAGLPPFPATRQSNITDTKPASVAAWRSMSASPAVQKQQPVAAGNAAPAPAPAPAPPFLPAIAIPKRRTTNKIAHRQTNPTGAYRPPVLNGRLPENREDLTLAPDDARPVEDRYSSPDRPTDGSESEVGERPQRPRSTSPWTEKDSCNAKSTRSMLGGGLVTKDMAHRGESDRNVNPQRTNRCEHGVHERLSRRGEVPTPTNLTPPMQHPSPLSNVSTPDRLEVSEATAVSIYPHNNDSLLLVRQRPRPDSHGHQRASDFEALRDSPSVVRNAEVSQLVTSPTEARRLPPEFRVIPPTPSVMSPVEEHDRQLGRRDGSTSGSNRSRVAGSGAISLVKRAFSGSRYIDSFVSPFARFKAGNGGDDSTRPGRSRNNGRQRSSLGTGKDTRLSPFWRPRGFWDDLDMDDLDVQDEFLDRGRVELFDAEAVQRRRSRSASLCTSVRRSRDESPWDRWRGGFDDGHDDEARRPSGHSRSRGRSRSYSRSRIQPGSPPSSSSSSATSSNLSNSSRRRATSLDGQRQHHPLRQHQRRVYTISPLGVQVEFVGWKGMQGMQQRLLRGKAARSEGARERERERRRVKHRISNPAVADRSRTWH